MQQVTGRVTQDAVIRKTGNGQEVVSFSIVDNETYKLKGSEETKQFSTFFKCAYWAGTGVAQVLRKGAVVQVTGRMSAQPYTTNTGDAAASLELSASRIDVLAYASKKEGGGTPDAKPSTNGSKQTKPEIIDDLPF